MAALRLVEPARQNCGQGLPCFRHHIPGGGNCRPLQTIGYLLKLADLGLVEAKPILHFALQSFILFCIDEVLGGGG